MSPNSTRQDQAQLSASPGEGAWRALGDSPKDGSEVELLIVHQNALVSSDPVAEGWIQIVRARWIDHNAGGWTWYGLAGLVMAWRPTTTAPTEASGSEREKLAATIKRHLLGVAPDDQDVVLEDDDWRLIIQALRPQPSGETREAVLKGVGKVNGDGWKDTTTEGEIVFVWNAEKPTPYAPGQYPRVGNEGWSASTSQYDFTPATADDVPAILALLSARPLALGGQQGEIEEALSCLADYDHTGRLEQAVRAALSTNPARAEAQDEGALSILDCLLDHSGARGSFDAMRHGDAVKDAEELLRSARSPGHTDLMVTPESIDAYMKDNPMEAQDEGAAGEIKSCPFCGGEAEIIHLDDDDNAGGSCVCCTKCQASGNVEFGRKENFVENWNRRSHPSPTPAADADRVRVAVEALKPFKLAADNMDGDEPDGLFIYDSPESTMISYGDLRRAASALAALKSEGKS